MSSKPDIILILCDQMRGDCLGVDGHPVAQTPNLDSFEFSGTRFSHAYSAVPSCLPARATIMTGQNQWHTGMLGMGNGQKQIPNDFPHTLAGEFTKAGYRTHMIGKGHFHPYRTLMGFETTELDESGRLPDSEHRKWFQEHAPAGVTPDDHGVNWNSWHARPWHTDEHLHPTAWTMNQSLEFLDTRDHECPFFLNISFARPHSPYVPPQYYFDLYNNRELPPPYIGDWDSIHEDSHMALNSNAWRGKMTTEQIHRARAGYLGEISFIDTQVGRLLNYIGRRADLRENTWIVFSSDHGDMQGDHNMWRKTYAYEGSTRIPFLIMPPTSADLECENRRIADEVVELRDIMPTLLDAAGIHIPDTVDGQSVLPLLKEPSEEWRTYLHGEHCTSYSADEEMHFVSNGYRKYIWFPRTGREQFFDLEQDPGECRSLIDDDTRQKEISLWRDYLVEELEKRDCGRVKDDKPFCPNEDPLISPYRDKRWPGKEYEKNSEYK